MWQGLWRVLKIELLKFGAVSKLFAPTELFAQNAIELSHSPLASQPCSSFFQSFLKFAGWSVIYKYYTNIIQHIKQIPYTYCANIIQNIIKNLPYWPFKTWWLLDPVSSWAAATEWQRGRRWIASNGDNLISWNTNLLSGNTNLIHILKHKSDFLKHNLISWDTNLISWNTNLISWNTTLRYLNSSEIYRLVPGLQEDRCCHM